MILYGVEYVTAAEACDRLGPDVKVALIADWVRRDLLVPAGRYPGRALLYRWLEVVEAEHKTRTERVGRPRDLPKIDSGETIAAISDQMPPMNAAQKWPVDVIAQIRAGKAKQLVSCSAPTDKPEVVYYMRLADRVKIGFTTDLRRRIVDVNADELLAAEPAGFHGHDLEQLRHKQFTAARIYRNREWFRLTDELRSHIAMLVDHFGTPETFLARPPMGPLPELDSTGRRILRSPTVR